MSFWRVSSLAARILPRDARRDRRGQLVAVAKSCWRGSEFIRKILNPQNFGSAKFQIRKIDFSDPQNFKSAKFQIRKINEIPF